VAGLAMLCWPLLLDHGSAGHETDAPLLFLLLLPALLAVVLAELGSGVLDAKSLAMLGVLSAIGAALRPLGAGTAGVELVFFLLVLAGRVYGPGFGFVLGSTTLFASALLTGGVGPWLPFQMLASSWIGCGAGLLPRATGRREIALLSAYGVVCAYAFGLLLNLSSWPFTIGFGGDLSFLPGAPLWTNLHRFLLYTLASSTWGWDTGRAVTNALAIVVVGPAVLTTLRRAARRAAFDAPVELDPLPAR
jgi:energy-coupling factor transport system substrate-specific component